MALSYPNIPGYLSLKADLHQHTVFSDGAVWPGIRVQESLRENLDAISLTEHLEYQPHLTTFRTQTETEPIIWHWRKHKITIC